MDAIFRGVSLKIAFIRVVHHSPPLTCPYKYYFQGRVTTLPPLKMANKNSRPLFFLLLTTHGLLGEDAARKSKKKSKKVREGFILDFLQVEGSQV